MSPPENSPMKSKPTTKGKATGCGKESGYRGFGMDKIKWHVPESALDEILLLLCWGGNTRRDGLCWEKIANSCSLVGTPYR